MSTFLRIHNKPFTRAALTARISLFFRRHPEWRAWACCLFAWFFIAINQRQFAAVGPVNRLYCMTNGAVLREQGTAWGELFAYYPPFLLQNLFPWLLMIIAMMFLLLREPLQHISVSVRKKNMVPAAFSFLLGYTLLWVVAGAGFLLLPFIGSYTLQGQSTLVKTIITAGIFMLAAILTWLPARPIQMARCSKTIPIRIEGWQVYSDSFYYGIVIGLACLHMCWAPMAAMLFTRHELLLMYIVTVVLFYERYLFTHTSRATGFAWITLAASLLLLQCWP